MESIRETILQTVFQQEFEQVANLCALIFVLKTYFSDRTVVS